MALIRPIASTRASNSHIQVRKMWYGRIPGAGIGER